MSVADDFENDLENDLFFFSQDMDTNKDLKA